LRVKIFIPLLKAYTCYLWTTLFNKNVCNSTLIKFKTEEELLQSDTVTSEDKLMVIVGSLIHFKDFQQTKWFKHMAPKIDNFSKISLTPKSTESENLEGSISPGAINHIFKVFSQKVNTLFYF